MIVGGGGHAKVVLDALLASGMAEPLGILDADERRAGRTLLGVPVLGGDDRLPEAVRMGATHYVVAIGSIGRCQPRIEAARRCDAAGLEPLAVRHPRAVVSEHATVGKGCQIMAGAIVQPGAVLSEHAIVNTGAIVEHDCSVGAFAHVATGARLCGNVQVGDQAHIGAGATIRQGIIVGFQAIVGAGAVVVGDVAPDTTVVGVPAKPVE